MSLGVGYWGGVAGRRGAGEGQGKGKGIERGRKGIEHAPVRIRKYVQ